MENVVIMSNDKSVTKKKMGDKKAANEIFTLRNEWIIFVSLKRVHLNISI